MLPSFIIIGAQKSATTFVHHCLSEHPDVFMPSEEIPFFEDPDYSQSDIESFKGLFKYGSYQKAIGFKRPTYLSRAEVPDRIHKHIPFARLITVLRNPIERAISAYYHYLLMGFGPIKNCNIGLLEIIRGKHTTQFPRTSEIIEFGFYYKHLIRYLECFDRERMLILLHDDIKTDALGIMKKIFRFLEIDEGYVSRLLNTRPMSTIYPVSRIRMLTLRNSIVYTYDVNRMRLFAKQKISLTGSVIVRFINFIDSKILYRALGNTKPNLSLELREALSAVYESDILKLEELLGISLSNWRLQHEN